MSNLYHFASVYGEGNYGECTYAVASSSTCPAVAEDSGNLPNTGIAVVGFVTLACLIIFIALITRIAGRRKKDVKRNKDK